jgi:hypothetical protein
MLREKSLKVMNEELESMTARWEVGSEFHWSDDAFALSSSENLFPESYELFSTGTGILLSLERLLKGDRTRLSIHLLTYFCMEVAEKMSGVFDLCWYRDLPTEPAPDFNSLRPLPGDLVLAVNLFGVKEGKSWQNWLTQQEDIILIEDHTHDPFSLWAQQTTAHYAIASLRKTLPIPDGAMIWSGRKMELPRPSQSESPAATQKLTAMLLKRAYLMGADISKDNYRILQMEGEQHLFNDGERAISTLTKNILLSLNNTEMRTRRETNINNFLEKLILNNKNDYWQPLFTDWKPGSVPFNSILLCKTYQIREELRRFLSSENIFASVHWSQPVEKVSSNDTLAFDLSNRLLTIPTDHRYSYHDIEQITAKMVLFSQSHRS